MNDQGRLSRNPIAVLVFIGLAEIAVAQLLFGPEGSTVVLSMHPGVQVIFAYSLLVSSVLVLAGIVMPEPRAYWLEAGGKAGCSVVLGVYTATLSYTVPSVNTSMGFVFSAIGIACVIRLVWLTMLILCNFFPDTWARIVAVGAAIKAAVARARARIRFRRRA